MATEYELTFTDYLSIMRRRAPYLIGVFVAALLIAIIVAFTLPPTYRSTGTIMVESPQVSDNIVPSAIKTQLDERINVIKQRVMTRDSLLQIANKYGLFKENKGFLTTSELIDKMRERVVVESISSGDAMHTNRQGQSTIAFTLSFEDRYPEVAHQVAKDLVTLFLGWNVKLRTEGATDTTAFFTQESDKLKAEVDRLEAQIAAYKRQNSNNLPEQMNLRANMLARAENDLHEVERDIRSTNEALRSLEAELSAAKRGIELSAAKNDPVDDPSQALQKLKAEYTKLSASYTESHPDIRALKRKIEVLEQSAATPGSISAPTTADTPGFKSAPDTAPSLAEFRLQTKVDATNARLDSLARQRKILQDKITQNEQAMVQTPLVAQGLETLIRDRDSAEKKYEELLNKKLNAKIAENLESENKSERFFLLEPPRLPEKPFKPDRIKILVLGFFLALASSGGAIMVLESIDKRVYGAEALTHVLGHRPLVVIPYLPIHEETVRKKRMLLWGIIAAVAILIAAAVALHFLYMPLDELFIKIMARLG